MGSKCNCKCTEDVKQLYDCCECGNKCRGCSCCNQDDGCNHCVNPNSIEFTGLCVDPAGRFANYTENLWRELTVSGTIAVPAEKPDIEDIIKIGSTVEIIRTRVINTPRGEANEPATNNEGLIVTGKKLIVEGLICLNVSYISATPEQSVHSFHGQIPFSTFIVVPLDFEEDYKLLADYCIESLQVESVCLRTIELCSCVFVAFTPVGSTCGSGETVCNGFSLACNNNNQDISPCCNQSDCDFKPRIRGEYDQDELALIEAGSEWTEIAVPELLNIPCQKPDIYQLLSVSSTVEMICQRIIVTPVRTINNEGVQLTGYKLIVNAMLKQMVTYVADCACGAVHAAHFDVPISAYIVLPPETFLTDKFNIEVFIEDIFACAMNERQIFKNTTLFIKATKIQPCAL